MSRSCQCLWLTRKKLKFLRQVTTLKTTMTSCVACPFLWFFIKFKSLFRLLVVTAPNSLSGGEDHMNTYKLLSRSLTSPGWNVSISCNGLRKKKLLSKYLEQRQYHIVIIEAFPSVSTANELFIIHENCYY